MSVPKTKLPKFLKPCFWWVKFDKLDIEQDRKFIIEQVLNYGAEDELDWLFKTYSEKEIKDVLQYPSRGNWFPRVLNYWINILNVKIDKHIHELALREIVWSKEKRKRVEKLLAKRMGVKL